MSHLILFCSAFITVFSLGFQSQNVNGGHYRWAALTSIFISLGFIGLYRLMPSATPTEILAYMAGGPLGITASMWVHRRTVGRQPDSGHRPPRPIPPPREWPPPPDEEGARLYTMPPRPSNPIKPDRPQS